MLSARTVGVASLNDELGTPDKRALGINSQIRGPAQQIARQEKLDTLVRHPLVRVEILALCVGVDRHLSWLASTDGSDEIQGDHAALLAGKLERRLCDMNLH